MTIHKQLSKESMKFNSFYALHTLV